MVGPWPPVSFGPDKKWQNMAPGMIVRTDAYIRRGMRSLEKDLLQARLFVHSRLNGQDKLTVTLRRRHISGKFARLSSKNRTCLLGCHFFHKGGKLSKARPGARQICDWTKLLCSGSLLWGLEGCWQVYSGSDRQNRDQESTLSRAGVSWW